jgi:GT2 family glycosyltransferase
MTLSTSLAPPALQPCEPPAAPPVSVCVVNWNCRALLRDCLASLLRHDQGVPLEVIVVDNASRDGAADMVGEEFPEVVLVRNAHNVGFSGANNQAARLATGRYLFFLNNDTLVPPETLQQLLDEAGRRPEAGILAPRLRDGQGRVQASCRAFPTVAALLHRTWMFRWNGLLRAAYYRYRARETALDLAQPVAVVMGAAMLIRRDVFDESGGWDEAFRFGGEDIDLCARVGKNHPVIFCPSAEVIHYGRASSRQRAGFAYSQTLIGITRFLRKHDTPPAALLLYKLAVTLDVPLRLGWHLTQFLWKKALGKRIGAARSWLDVRGVSHFLRRGLWGFWKV